MIVTDISKILLSTFIECTIHGNLSALGDGTEIELQDAYEEVLSQYYQARDDQHMNEYIRLLKQAGLYRVRLELVNTIIGICIERHSEAGLAILREYYPQMKFVEPTIHEDLKRARNGEISQRMRYDTIIQQLKKMDDAKGDKKTTTPAQKIKSVITTLMDISKVEGVRYDMATMTVLEYAIAENRLIEHIENLKNQANGR